MKQGKWSPEEKLAFLRITSVVMFLLYMLATMPSWAEKLMPVDESDKAPGFSAFKKKLLVALEKHDKKFIYSLVTPDGRFSFGPEKPGLEGFKQMYHLDDPDETFWADMKRILRLGGTVNGERTEVVFPYVHSKFPSRYSGYDYCVITSNAVKVHEKPDKEARVITTLSYDIVEKIYVAEGEWLDVWTKIKIPGGRTGFVLNTNIYSPIGRRAFFSRIGGQWKLTAFIGGD